MSNDNASKQLMLNPDNPKERQMMIQEREFGLVQRQAQALAASNVIPAQFKENTANCMIALEMAERLKTGAMEIMQNLYVVHGNPAFSSKYLIALINMSGILHGRLKFEFEGEPGSDEYSCYAVGIEKETMQELRGTRVTIKMAKDQGWWGKTGSKWPSMTDQMMCYRAAAFWSRIHAPEATMGMMSVDERQDTEEIDITPPKEEASTSTASVNETLKGAGDLPDDEPVVISGTATVVTEEEEELPDDEPEPVMEWPQLVDNVWADKAGEVFDADEHQWVQGEDKPRVKADGTFCKKPGKKGPAKEPVQESLVAEPEGDTNADSEKAYSGLVGLLDFAKDLADLDKVISMPGWEKLTDADKQKLHAAIDEKRGKLKK